jgi:hypothetical protein
MQLRTVQTAAVGAGTFLYDEFSVHEQRRGGAGHCRSHSTATGTHRASVNDTEIAASAHCTGGGAQPPIQTQVIACHHLGGEPLLKHPAYSPAVDLVKLENRRHGFVSSVSTMNPVFPSSTISTTGVHNVSFPSCRQSPLDLGWGLRDGRPLRFFAGLVVTQDRGKEHANNSGRTPG